MRELLISPCSLGNNLWGIYILAYGWALLLLFLLVTHPKCKILVYSPFLESLAHHIPKRYQGKPWFKSLCPASWYKVHQQRKSSAANISPYLYSVLKNQKNDNTAEQWPDNISSDNNPPYKIRLQDENIYNWHTHELLSQN